MAQSTDQIKRPIKQPSNQKPKTRQCNIGDDVVIPSSHWVMDSRVDSLILRSQDYSVTRTDYDHLGWRQFRSPGKSLLNKPGNFFTDGSKLNGQVGSSTCVFCMVKKFNISYVVFLIASVFATEITGMDMPCHGFRSLTIWVRISLDSLCVITSGWLATITVDQWFGL
ncbi:hypothetical protein AVEN_7949-1 [Araneus ventricosus]|uniref:Uncharacterized protein n=1 Tax=Araneus ventricosus TaxID=182803 RepID=A0A4Y2D2Z4_ARAVE|nr:hypothetical protein AVEN_7949-1 [Araneus ventricosus]